MADDVIWPVSPLPDLDYTEPPRGSDRRTFMMRSALAAALTGRPIVAFAQTPATAPPVSTDPNLDVVRRSHGPI